MTDRGIGIDIGTSKISVCINNGGRIDKLQLASLNKEFPCCIYYNNEVLFGEEARIKGQSKPQFCFKHLKSLIGRLYSDEYVQYMKDHMSYNIVAGENDRVMVEVCEKNQKVLKDPTELLSMLVNYVIQDAQNRMGNKRIEYLALAFPPSFNDSQKMELKKIGILTGIRHIDLYPETTAACIYYGITSMVPGQTVMVVDCGAGTCDATILKYDNGFEVVGHAGKDRIGGDRYTQQLMDYVLKQYEIKGAPMKKMSNKKKGQLEDTVENAKITLRTSKSIDVDIGDENFQPITITEGRLNVLSNELNREISSMVKGLIASTECKPNNIILSGKGMYLKSLAGAVCKEVGLEEMTMNLDEPVAHGLAMYLVEIIERHKEDDHCNKIRVFGDASIEPSNLTNSCPPIPDSPGLSMVGPADYESSLPENPHPLHFNTPCVDSSVPKETSAPFSNPADSPVNDMPNTTAPTEDPNHADFSLPGVLNESFPAIESMPPMEGKPGEDFYSHEDTNHDVEEHEEEEEIDSGVAHILNTHNEEFGSFSESINPDDIPLLDVDEIDQTIPFVSSDDPTPNMPNGFRITEKRSHDLSIHITRKATTNRMLLLSRNEPLPCNKRCALKVKKGKAFQFSLYEGNSQWERNNTRIRHTILERDDEHPDTSDYKFNLMLEVDKTGFINTSFEWDDTKKPIRVIEDQELNKHAEISMLGSRIGNPNNTTGMDSSLYQSFPNPEGAYVPIPVVDGEIHKPTAIERPVQQNDQAFNDIKACKEAIRKVISRIKGEFMKMKPKDKEDIEDFISNTETILPLHDSLTTVNEIYLSVKEVEKKVDSIISAPTRERELVLE